MLTIGTILYVALLLINAVAVLSEDRFLARSVFWLPSPLALTHITPFCSRLDLNATSELQRWFPSVL
jgi:hypothetical protein